MVIFYFEKSHLEFIAKNRKIAKILFSDFANQKRPGIQYRGVDSRMQDG